MTSKVTPTTETDDDVRVIDLEAPIVDTASAGGPADPAPADTSNNATSTPHSGSGSSDDGDHLNDEQFLALKQLHDAGEISEEEFIRALTALGTNAALVEADMRAAGGGAGPRSSVGARASVDATVVRPLVAAARLRGLILERLLGGRQRRQRRLVPPKLRLDQPEQHPRLAGRWRRPRDVGQQLHRLLEPTCHGESTPLLHLLHYRLWKVDFSCRFAGYRRLLWGRGRSGRRWRPRLPARL